MDWLARNSEFLSPESITKCLIAFKDLYKSENTISRNSYIQTATSSHAVLAVLALIYNTKALGSDEEVNSRLAILLSVFEALLINENNLEKALQPAVKALDTLSSVLILPRTLKQAAMEIEEDEDPRLKVPIHLKYTLRCLASCMRSSGGVVMFINIDNGVQKVLEFMEFTKDEEVQANCSKIIRICLRDELHYDRVTSLHSDLGNLLLRNCGNFIFSDVVLTELLAAVRNFSKSTPKVAFI
jgi:hypothetical protein